MQLESSPVGQPLPVAAPLLEKRWPEIDGLRGTAILLVFLLHYVTDTRTHEGDFGLLYRFAQIFRLGWSGVDLFSYFLVSLLGVSCWTPGPAQIIFERSTPAEFIASCPSTTFGQRYTVSRVTQL